MCGEFANGIDVLNVEFCIGSANGIYGLAMGSSNVSSATRYSNCVFSNNGLVGVNHAGSGTAETRTNNTMTGSPGGPTFGAIIPFSPN